MQLTKYPTEVRYYIWEFLDASLGSTSTRGNIWAQDSFDTNEHFQPALTLPLIFSLLTTAGTATISVIRSDGQASDLTVGTPTISGTQVTAVLSGGTTGLVYTLTVLATTSAGNTIACQGQLLVSVNIAV